MKKIAQITDVILGLQGTQYNVTDSIRRHFEHAVINAVAAKDPNHKIEDAMAVYDRHVAGRVSPVKGLADALGISKNSLQREIYAQLEGGVYGYKVKHITPDYKLLRATRRAAVHVNFATVTRLSGDFAEEFYRVSGLRDIHARESIFAHEDVDFANKTTQAAYLPALAHLGYQEGDDLSTVLVVDNNAAHLACAKSMGMKTALLGGQNKGLVQGAQIDFEYQNIKGLLHELYRAKESAQPKQAARLTWELPFLFKQP